MAKKLLIVDDEPSIQKLIGRHLKQEGYEVLTAGDGPEALDIIRRENLGLVLLDICMPELDGLEVLRTALEMRPSLPIVILTGAMDMRMAERMMRAGAKDYLTKPIDWNSLERTVLALAA